MIYLYVEQPDMATIESYSDINSQTIIVVDKIRAGIDVVF